MNGPRDNLTFGDFIVPKFALYNRVINKKRAIKNEENSAHRFADKYLTNGHY